MSHSQKSIFFFFKEIHKNSSTCLENRKKKQTKKNIVHDFCVHVKCQKVTFMRYCSLCKWIIQQHSLVGKAGVGHSLHTSLNSSRPYHLHIGGFTRHHCSHFDLSPAALSSLKARQSSLRHACRGNSPVQSAATSEGERSGRFNL